MSDERPPEELTNQQEEGPTVVTPASQPAKVRVPWKAPDKSSEYSLDTKPAGAGTLCVCTFSYCNLEKAVAVLQDIAHLNANGIMFAYIGTQPYLCTVEFFKAIVYCPAKLKARTRIEGFMNEIEAEGIELGMMNDDWKGKWLQM